MKKPIVIIASEKNQADYYQLSELKERVEVYAGMKSAKLSLMNAFDLVILDCGENSDAGIKTVLQIKKHHPGIPIVFITSVSSEEITVKAFNAGVRKYLRKPISFNMLKEIVADLLRLKRLPGEKQESLKTGIDTGSSRPVTSGLPNRLERTVRYIEDNFTDTLYLDKLARNACLSKYHFCRVFKLYVGMTPMEFITFVRIERARMLLARPDYNITEVAHKTGFNNASDFSKKFKHLTGITPLSYKSLLINNTRP